MLDWVEENKKSSKEFDRLLLDKVYFPTFERVSPDLAQEALEAQEEEEEKLREKEEGSEASEDASEKSEEESSAEQASKSEESSSADEGMIRSSKHFLTYIF